MDGSVLWIATEDRRGAMTRVAALALLVGVTAMPPAVWAQTRASVTGEAYGSARHRDGDQDPAGGSAWRRDGRLTI